MRWSLVFEGLAAVAAVMAAWSGFSPKNSNGELIAFAVAALALYVIAKVIENREERAHEARQTAIANRQHGEVRDDFGRIHSDSALTHTGLQEIKVALAAPVERPRIRIIASLGNPVVFVGAPQHHSKAWYHLSIHNDGGVSLFRVAITVDTVFAHGMLVTGQQALWWNSEEESKSLMQGEEADIALGYVERSAPDNRVVYVELGPDARGTRPPCWQAFPSDSAPHPSVEFEVLITADPQIEGGAQRHRFRIDGDGIRQLEPGTQPVRVGLRLRDMLSPPWRWPRN
jgi:hypothetical protein